jgi:hypothetical protein
MIRSRFLCSAFAFMILVSGSAFADALTVFNFETSLPGAVVPLDITNGGITASFSSTGGVGAFNVTPGFFFNDPIQGNVLGDFDPVAHALDIRFNQSMRFLTLDFALDNLGGPQGSLAVDAFLRGNLVGHTVALAAVPLGGFFEQGTLAFGIGGVEFDSVRLTSTRENFAIDNVAVALPLPSTLLLMAVGAVTLGLQFRRR